LTEPRTIYLNAFINNVTAASSITMTKSFITAKLLAIAGIEQLTPLQVLLKNKTLYARYSGASFNSIGNLLVDESGNGRHATCVGVTQSSGTGNGATTTINYVQGSTTSNIQFPTGSLPAGGSICIISRYSGTNKQRIFQSSGLGATDNRIYGHHGGKTGVCVDGGELRTPFSNNPTGSNLDRWVVLCYSPNIAIPNNVLVDNGVPIGSATGTSPDGTLCVNKLGINEFSDFQIAQVIIFNESLTAEELKIVSNSYNGYLANGIIR
jgi:hypothetical protein